LWCACVSSPPQRYDSRRYRLDLERDLDGRNPPGGVGHVQVEDPLAEKYRRRSTHTHMTKETNIGRALVSSHRLTDPECQCRHDLTIDGVLTCMPTSCLRSCFLLLLSLGKPCWPEERAS